MKSFDENISTTYLNKKKLRSNEILCQENILVHENRYFNLYYGYIDKYLTE